MDRIATVFAWVGLLALAGAAGSPTLRAAEPAPADSVQYTASSSAGWQVDALTDYLHLADLCATNLRHAEQELAALNTPGPGSPAGDFPLQKLLQGQGATIDLTEPYQAHVTADSIEPAPAPAQPVAPAQPIPPAGGSSTAGPAAASPYIRARRFHLRQKVPGSDKPGALATFLTLNADQADFGVVASTTAPPAGAGRTLGVSDPNQDAARMLSWPFVADLQNAVQVRYARAPDGGPAAPPIPTGVMGDLSGLSFTAPRIHVLLAGDRRAGRCLFWAPPPAGATATNAEPPAKLEAGFDGGVSLTVEARGLEVELAWNAETGATEIRWAGVGHVHLILSGLRRDAKPGSAQAATERWELTADAFALISLPGRSGYAGPLEELAAHEKNVDWPQTLPASDTPTFVLCAQGNATLTQTAQSAGGTPAGASKPATPELLVALFDQGLFELERNGPGANSDGIGVSVGGTHSEPVLERAWLCGGGLVPPDETVARLFAESPEFYRPRLRDWRADWWRAPLVAEHRPHARKPIPTASVSAHGLLLRAPSSNALTADGANGANSGRVLAQRIFYQRQGASFQVRAAGAPENPVAWADGVHLLEAPRIDLTGGILTCTGAGRYLVQDASEALGTPGVPDEPAKQGATP